MEKNTIILIILLIVLSCKEQTDTSVDINHQILKTDQCRDTIDISDVMSHEIDIGVSCSDVQTSWTDVRGNTFNNFKVGDTVLLYLEFIGKDDLFEQNHELYIVPYANNEYPFRRIEKGVYQILTYETGTNMLAYEILISSRKTFFTNKWLDPDSEKNYEGKYPLCAKSEAL